MERAWTGFQFRKGKGYLFSRVGKEDRQAGWGSAGLGVETSGFCQMLGKLVTGDILLGRGRVFEEVLVYSGKGCLAGKASTRGLRCVGRS